MVPENPSRTRSILPFASESTVSRVTMTGVSGTPSLTATAPVELEATPARSKTAPAAERATVPLAVTGFAPVRARMTTASFGEAPEFTEAIVLTVSPASVKSAVARLVSSTGSEKVTSTDWVVRVLALAMRGATLSAAGTGAWSGSSFGVPSLSVTSPYSAEYETSGVAPPGMTPSAKAR